MNLRYYIATEVHQGIITDITTRVLGKWPLIYTELINLQRR